MKNRQKILLVLILLALTSNAVSYADNPIIKLSRGLTNIVTSPGEYLVQYKVIRSEYPFVQAFFATLMSGTLHMVGRMLVGVYDTETFLVPLPANYEPLYKPATFFEALEEVNGGKI